MGPNMLISKQSIIENYWIIYRIVIIAVQLVLVFRGFNTVKRIRKKDYDIRPEYDTYCSISVLIIRLIQVQLTISAVYNSLAILETITDSIPE